MLSCLLTWERDALRPEHSTQRRTRPVYAQEDARGRARWSRAALEHVRSQGSGTQNREEGPCCPRPRLPVGSASLSRPCPQDSLQEPLGLGQDSLLKLGIPRQEGSIDLHGQKEQFRRKRGEASSISLQLEIENLYIPFTGHLMFLLGRRKEASNHKKRKCYCFSNLEFKMFLKANYDKKPIFVIKSTKLKSKFW